MRLQLLLIFIPILALGLVSCARKPSPPPTVGSLDKSRYAGEWHEIARLPNTFEKNLVAAKATYGMNPDGSLSVLNQGLKKDGSRTRIEGTATIPDPKHPGRLKVRFDRFPANLFAGDYWILKVDKNYNHALVGSPDRKFLWLLSKRQADGKKEFAAYINAADELGYPTANLYFNPKRIAR